MRNPAYMAPNAQGTPNPDMPQSLAAHGETTTFRPGVRMPAPTTLHRHGGVTPAPTGHISAGSRGELGKLSPIHASSIRAKAATK